MPLLALTPHKLRLLSAFARSRPRPSSPLRRLGLLAPADEEGLVRELLAEGLLVRTTANTPRVHPRLEPLLFMLHRPEHSLSISRIGRQAPLETFLCRTGKIWAMDAVGLEARGQPIADGPGVDLLTWPVPDAAMGTWLAEEVVDGSALFTSGQEWQVELSLGAWTLLAAMMAAYRDRLGGKPLAGGELWLSPAEIRAQGATVQPAVAAFTPPEGMAHFFAGPWTRFADELVAARLVHARDGHSALTTTAREALDPGRLAGMVRVSRFAGEEVGARLLYLLDRGGLLVSQAGPLSLRVRRVHPSTPQAAWTLLSTRW